TLAADGKQRAPGFKPVIIGSRTKDNSRLDQTAYSIPPNLLRAIESMYAGTRAKVVTPDGNSEEFDILAGVMQGDTLAPFLFIIVLDYALRKAINGREQELGFTLSPRKSSRYPAVVLTDLDFADDISLLSDNVEQAQILLSRVELECAKVGLRLNAKKTEVITYNIPPEHLPLTTAGGTVLNEVDDFKYLGSWVNSTEQDLKVRKALAWRALNGMASVWNSSLPRQIKLSFFYATVESVLLYGSEYAVEDLKRADHAEKTLQCVC
uniref:Reverse transcriptase domain-containing protein n=1 Tax=Astyanax mexicanus TaxID=7994 RepID=A0A3B1IYM6_ASTMX